MSDLADAQAAIAGTITNELFGEPAAAEAPEAVAAPAAAQTPEPPEAAVAEPEASDPDEVVEFNYNPKLPEDIAAELAAADIDEQVEAEVAAYTPPVDDYGDPVDVDTDEVRERIKAQKRIEYLEQQLVASKRSAWEQEAEKYFPLSKTALGEITATSRRAFLKQAKARHEAILPHVQAALEQAQVFAKTEVADVVQAEKQAAAERWGAPVTGPDTAILQSAGNESDIAREREKAKQTGNLTGLFKKMMQGGA